MKTLVTGAAGFIGSNLVKLLLKSGREVRAMHLPGENLINLEGLDVELYQGDITDAASMRGAVEGCELVFHLAAIYALWLPDESLFRKVNVEGTRNVLGAALAAGVEKVVHTRSIANFGGQGPDADANEESPFAFADTGDEYSISKHESHLVAEEFARKGLDVTIAAPCGPLGPGDVGPTPTGTLLLTAANMPAMFITDTISNMVDVRDVAAGHLLAAEKGVTGESYLLGCRNATFNELVEMVFDVTGIHKKIIKIPGPIFTSIGYGMLTYSKFISKKPPLMTPAALRIGAMGLRADSSKAVRELGMPQTPLEKSVRDALVWFAENGYIASKKTVSNILEARDPSKATQREIT